MASQTDFEKYENRLRTFNTWPTESDVHIKDLVEAGFSYTGESDFVFCCCCQLRIGNWKNCDEPIKRHETENTSCPYLVRRRKLLEEARAKCDQQATWPNTNHQANSANENTGNFDPRVTNYPGCSREKPAREQDGVKPRAILPNEKENIAKNKPPSVILLDNCNIDINMDTEEMNVRREPQSNKQTAKQTADFPRLIMPQNNHKHAQGNEYCSPSAYSPRTKPETSPQVRLSPAVHSPRRSPSPSGWRVQLNDPNSHVPQGSGRSMMEQRNEYFPREFAIPGSPHQGLNVERTSKPANMSNQAARLNTFFTWPQDIPVQPLALAEAGFYYLMKDDGVKCYKCDIALRNWEVDDIPWVEHAKWSPRCPLVKEHLSPAASPGSFPDHSNVQMSRPNRPNQSPLSALSYALPSGQVPSLSASYSFSNEAPIEVQSGFNVIGFGNAIVNQPSQRQNSQPDEVLNQGSPAYTDANHDDVETVLGPLSNTEIDILLDAGFTLETISKVQKLCYQKTQSYFDSVETVADAIMYFFENGSLDGHSVRPSSKSNAGNNNNNNSNDENNHLDSSTSNVATELQAQKQEDELELKRELERVRERQTCKICMDEQVGVVFFPCKHLMTCPDCSVGLKQCPLCRATIESSSRIYLS